MRWLLLLTSLTAVTVTAETISGKVVAIQDGDTLTVIDAGKRQHKIRLAEIDAPEKKQSFGSKSRESLSEICFEKLATVVTRQKDRNGRPIGHVKCNGVDANAEQVRRGMAWVFVKYAKPTSPLYDMERNAKSGRVGLWAEEKPLSPWEWRAAQGAKQVKQSQ